MNRITELYRETAKAIDNRFVRAEKLLEGYPQVHGTAIDIGLSGASIDWRRTGDGMSIVFLVDGAKVTGSFMFPGNVTVTHRIQGMRYLPLLIEQVRKAYEKTLLDAEVQLQYVDEMLDQLEKGSSDGSE